MICFVIAMEKEAAPVLAQTEKKKERYICGKRVISGKIYGKKTAVVICGIGKVNAAVGAQIAIDRLKADKIINLGVAGGIKKDLEIGDIYGISAAVQYDFDLAAINGTAIGTLDEFKENYIPLNVKNLFPLKKLATGDRFNDSKDDFKLLTNVLNADIRDMEGGAIAQVCTHAKIEFYSFKAISDVYGRGSTAKQYMENTELCMSRFSERLKDIWGVICG